VVCVTATVKIKIFHRNKKFSYILKMEVKRENVLSAGIKMEKGITVKREPLFGPGILSRIKREFSSMSPMMIKREFKAEPVDIKPQMPPMGITPKLEPNTVQANRVTEVMKRHFKGEPGATDKGTVDPKKPRPAAPAPPPALEKKFKCHRCSYAATKIASLDNHVRYKHMKEPKPFRCTYHGNCGFTAMTNGSIVSHVNRVHLKVKRFKCPVPGCSYAGVYQRNLNQHVKINHPERAPPVARPRKIKNETDSSNASESDNDEIEILSVSDAVITLSDEDSPNSLNNSMDSSDILEDSGINLNEGGDGTEGQGATKENQEGSGVALEQSGEKATEMETADAEFVRSLIESAFWFAVSGAEERGRDGPNKDQKAESNTVEASNNDDGVASAADKEASSVNPKDSSSAQDPSSGDVQIIISDELDARRGSSADSGVELDATDRNVAMVEGIIEEILNNVSATGTASASGDEGRGGGGGDQQDNETVVPASPVECDVVETIGIDEDDIVELDCIAEDGGGIEVLSEVSHNEIWSLPEIIMLDD